MRRQIHWLSLLTNSFSLCKTSLSKTLTKNFFFERPPRPSDSLVVINLKKKSEEDMEAFKKIILSATVIMTMAACAKMEFAPVEQMADKSLAIVDPGKTIVCGPNQVKIARPTRVLFVVDQSGSNVNGPYEAPGQATDPQKSFRLQVMREFYQANQSKANLSWGLNVFNGTAAANLMTSSGGQSVPFSPLASDFNNALVSFNSRSDVGVTPYRAALNMVKQVISADLPTAPAHVSYLVAFLTDGYPTDYCPNSPTEVSCAGRILESQIDADVQSIANLGNGAVQFSTVYYGKPDSDAAKRLSRMAVIGGGEFVDTNTNVHVSLNDILSVEKEVCVEK